MGTAAVEDVERALRRLRKDDGLTLSKVHDDPDLRGVFGDYQPIEMYNLIALGLEEIPQGRSAEAARTALNVKIRRPKDDTGGAAKHNLTTRRLKLATRWGRADLHHDQAKLGSVRMREDQGLRELAVWLASMTTRLLVPDGTSETTFVWADEETTYIYRNGLLTDVLYEAEVRSLSAGLDFVRTQLPIALGGARLESPSSMYGCIAGSAIGPDDIELRLRLSRRLHFGQTHRFLVQFRVFDAEYNSILTPLAGRERATLRLQFDRPFPQIVIDGKLAALDEGGYFWRTWQEFGANRMVTNLHWD